MGGSQAIHPPWPHPVVPRLASGADSEIIRPVFEGHHRFAVTFVDGYVIFVEAETLERAASLAIQIDYSDISKVATVMPVDR